MFGGTVAPSNVANCASLVWQTIALGGVVHLRVHLLLVSRASQANPVLSLPLFFTSFILYISSSSSCALKSAVLQFCRLAEILKLQKLCRERSGYNTSQIMTMIPIKRLAIELHWPCTSILLAVISLILARFPPNYFHFYLRTCIPVSPNYLKRRFKRIFLLNISFFHISHNGLLPLD